MIGKAKPLKPGDSLWRTLQTATSRDRLGDSGYRFVNNTHDDKHFIVAGTEWHTVYTPLTSAEHYVTQLDELREEGFAISVILVQVPVEHQRTVALC